MASRRGAELLTPPIIRSGAGITGSRRRRFAASEDSGSGDAMARARGGEA